MNHPVQASNPIEERLIRAGGFNPDDLAFNQAGELSERQRRWLRLEVAAWVFQIGVNLVLMACAWLFYYFQDNMQTFLLGGLSWSVGLAISILFCLEHARPIWDDIQGNQVKSISGTVLKRSGFGKGVNQSQYKNVRGIAWSLKIRDQMFSVHSRLYHSVIANETYRLFYTPNLKRVINIEPLQERARENEE